MKLPVVVKYSDDPHGVMKRYGLLVKADEKFDYLIPVENEMVRVKKYRNDGARAADFEVYEYLDEYAVEGFWKVVNAKVEKYGITKEAEAYR